LSTTDKLDLQKSDYFELQSSRASDVAHHCTGYFCNVIVMIVGGGGFFVVVGTAFAVFCF
jgi:hypothetical protein